MATINDYTKTEWVNDTTPAIDAEHLNKIEEGIYDNRVAVNELLTDIDTKAPSVSPTLRFGITASANGNSNPHVELRETGSTPIKGMGIAIYNEDGTLKSINDLVTSAGNRNFATVSEVNAKAPLASPALTGTPTAPTAPAGTNTTQIATTAYVQSSLDGWRFYDKDAFSTSTSLATICSSLPNYSIWIKNIASVNDFGGVPSVGLLQITKFTASRCILELNYVTASATSSRKYVASYASTPGTVSEWTRLMQESDLYYFAGNSFAASGAVILSGYSGYANKNLYFTCQLPKSLENITSVSVSRFTGAVRGIGGYLNNSTDSTNWLTDSSVTSVTASIVAPNMVRIQIVTSAGMSGATVNTPVVFNGQVTFNFS